MRISRQFRRHAFDLRGIDDYDVTVADEPRALFAASPMLRSFHNMTVALHTVELMSYYVLPHATARLELPMTVLRL